MITLLAAALLPILGSPALPQDAPTPVAVEDRGDMDPEIAALIADYLARAQADPANGEVHAELGLVYEANTLFGAAARSYANAIALLPERPEWVFRRAMALEAFGDTEAALAEMRKAAGILKNTPVIQARLGSMLMAIGDVAGADAAWSQAINAEAKQPQPVAWPQSRVGLCQVRIAQERWAEASEVLEMIVAETPGYRHARYLLGLCYVELGRHGDAEVHLQAGVNAWPEFPPDPHQPRLDGFSVGYHRRMMNIENMMMAGNIPAATAALTALLEKSPTNHAVLHLLGRAKLMTGEMDAGIEILRQAEATNPRSVDIKIELAGALMNKVTMSATALTPVERQALMAEILSRSQEAIALAPNLGRPHYFHGLAVSMSLDPQNPDPQILNTALRSLSTALQLGCNEMQLLERLASLYAQTGRQAEMLRFAIANAERNMGNPAAFLFLAQAQFTVGNNDLGVASGKRAFELAPRDPYVAMFYTQSLVSTHQMDEAVRIAEWMAKVMPANAEVQTFCKNVLSVAETGGLPGAGDTPPITPPVKNPGGGSGG